MLKVKLLNDDARPPSKGSEEAAGLDLYSCEDAVIQPGDRALIKTGISIAVPPGNVGLIWPRSGLALNQGIDVLAGVIDSDYRGELGVVLINHSVDTAIIQKGDRIAQLLIQPILNTPVVVVDELSDRGRGTAGFGSTGR